MQKEPHRLVFIDETSITTKMTRTHGRCLLGKRLNAFVPFGHWKTQTFIAALRYNELTAPWMIDGAMTQQKFEIYLETQLAPTLNPGDVVILDNASIHKSANVDTILSKRGAWALFLPPYSPDLNPIETAFSKLKTLLRKKGARTIEALIETAGEISKLYTQQECRNLFRNFGYAP